MEELFRQKLRFFLGGCFAGVISGGYGLFSLPILGTSIGTLVYEYTIRFFGTIFIAFVSGVLTVMFKDFYDIVIKHRAHSFFWFINRKLSFKKKIKKEDDRQDKNAA